MVWSGILQWLASPSKQLIVDWIPAGVKSVCMQRLCMKNSLFLNTDININLNNSSDNMIWSETDIKIIFDDEDDSFFMALQEKISLLLHQM